MAKTILAALLLVTSLARADWTCVGPFGGTIYSGSYCVESPEVIYLSPRTYPTPLLKSTDAGATWTQTSQLGYFCFGMAVHPDDPNTVMCATGALYRTTNGGTSWTYLSIPGGSYAQAVAYDPLEPRKLIAAGYGYAGYNHFAIYRTTDGGASWDTIGLDTMHYSIGYAVAYDPIDPDIIYAGGYNGQPTVVYKSIDGGISWERIPTGFNGYYCYALHVSPLDHNIVLAGSYYQGILRSTDQGRTWTRVATYGPIYAFSAVPEQPATIYASADSALYLSEDTGRTWVPVPNRPRGVWGRTCFVTPGSPGRLYLGCKSGFYCSTDQGLNWTSLLAEVPFARVQTMTLPESEPEGLWIECKDDGVYHTTDNGNNWLRCSDFLSCGNICGLAVDPRSPLVIWALEGAG